MITAIILAAGESRRMGRPKPLLPFGQATVIEHIAGRVLESGVEETLVVVGHEPEGIEDRLRDVPVRLVRNPDYQTGMLSSVRCGLRAASLSSSAAMILLGDQPNIRAQWLTRLILHFEQGRHGILVPTYQGRRGHPLIFSMAYRGEILSEYDNAGLRGLLARHEEEVETLDFEDPDVLEDMDTPEDYAHALRRKRETRDSG